MEIIRKCCSKFRALRERECVAKSSVSRVRLPKLDLPVFNGEITKWFTFWDSYKAAVNDNPELLPIQKFANLHSLICRRNIAGLTLTDANICLFVFIFYPIL